MREKIFIFSLAVMLALLSSTEKAEAAFVASPMEFHLNVASGESGTHTFWVRNRGEETIALKVYTGDFWIEPNGKELFLKPGEVERSCAGWLELAPEELELAPGESRAIRFKINVPVEKIGSYWAMIFVEQTTKPTIRTAKRGERQFSIIAFQRIGVRIFEETPQAEMGEGKISQVSVARGTEDEFLKISLRFENEGDIRLKCKGRVEIKDEKGETVKNIELSEFNCYPKAERELGVSLKERLAPGQYSALAIIDYGAEHLVAGETVFEIKGE